MSKKKEGLFDFGWFVHEGGYRWVTAVGELSRGRGTHEGDYLTDDCPLGVERAVRSYRPLEESGLFVKFAELGTDEGSIVAFANQYGPLGANLTSQIYIKDPADPTRDVMGTGELRSDWVEEIDQFRQAHLLWDLLRRNDVRELSRYINWKKGVGVRYIYESPNGLVRNSIATERGHPELLARIRYGDVILPARIQMQAIVNSGLRNRVSPRLLRRKADESLGLFMVPNGLIGALWLQMAQAIAGSKKFRNCRRCGASFELSPAGFRTNRVFCSDPCKTQAYRDRKETAQRMHTEGSPPEDIATALDTGPEVVKRWLGETGKKKPERG